MTIQIFAASKLKIERANRHISDLDQTLNAFRESKPYRIVIEKDSDPEMCRLVVRTGIELPSEFSAIIGDAVHNLRAALDLLACDLVRQNGGDVEEVYFPFCANGNDLELMIKKRHIDRAAPQVVDIIRSLKPYTGGNVALRGIHDLDITDKHKLLIPIIAINRIQNFAPTMGGFPMFTLQNVGLLNAVDGRVVAVLPIPENYKIGQNFDPIIDIAFGEGQPFIYEALIPTLHQVSQLVDGIVNIFIKHFESLPNLCALRFVKDERLP